MSVNDFSVYMLFVYFLVILTYFFDNRDFSVVVLNNVFTTLLLGFGYK